MENGMKILLYLKITKMAGQSLHDIVPAFFFSPLYILYNNVYKKYFVFSLKKCVWFFVMLWKVSTFAPANEKQRRLRSSSLKDFT